MSEVYELKMARAWLNLALVGEGKPHADAALSLVAEVAADPNGQGRRHAKAIAALRAALQRPKAAKG